MITPSQEVAVVIVGGGIAGSALAWNLAAADIPVLLLESQQNYRDKVRGEVLNCWGVHEARALGVDEALTIAGGNYAPRFVGYDETLQPSEAEARAVDVSAMLPDVPGVLTVGHPELCQALSEGAAKRGARVTAGTSLLYARPSPHGCTTTFRDADGGQHTVTSRIIVGADGRLSKCRRDFGVTLTQDEPRSLGGGLLVDGLDSWRLDTTWIGTEGNLLYFIYPRPGGRARLYLLHNPNDRRRFAGPDAKQHFINAYKKLTCVPGAEHLFADTRPAYATTPCGFFPMNDSRTDEVSVPGGILIGDAAGWSDPIIGQGLCVALRDAQLVSTALRNHPVWDQSIFDDYATERRTRMSRLATSGRVRSEMALTFTRAGRERRRRYADIWPTDPTLAGSRLATLKGPHNVPAESFNDDAINYLLNC